LEQVYEKDNEMVDQVDAVEQDVEPEAVEPLRIVDYAINEAVEQLSQVGAFEPFSVILVGDEMNIESYGGEDAVEVFNAARETIQQMELLADAYVFVYDGYLNTDDGDKDAVIAEFCLKGEEVGSAYAVIYTENNDSLEIEEQVYEIGEAQSLFTAPPFEAEQLEEQE
jgi:hypothetical protein